MREREANNNTGKFFNFVYILSSIKLDILIIT